MDWLVLVVAPVPAVFAGAWITYALNARSRRTGDIEKIFHDAIAATGVAVASLHYHSEVGRWTHATDSDYGAFLSELGRDANRDHVRAVAAARAAVARAAAYEPSLRRYYLLPVPEFLDHSDDVIAVLRSRLGGSS